MYLIINFATGFKKNEEKYLILDSTEKYEELWSGIRSEIEILNGGGELVYKKNYSRNGINTDDHLPLNKPMNFLTLTIIIRCVFQEGEKLYPQIYLDEFLYELYTMIQLDRIEDYEKIDLDETGESKECKICHYNYFDDSFKSDSKICNKCNWRIKSFGNFAIIAVNVFSYRSFMFGMGEEDAIESIKDFESNDKFKTTFQYERIDIRRN